MKRGDCFDQAQAKSISRRAAAAFQPVKALEHTCALFAWDSRPAIVHCDGYRVCRLAGYKADGCSPRRMLHCVLNYICNHLRQELAVAPDTEAGGHIGGKR